MGGRFVPIVIELSLREVEATSLLVVGNKVDHFLLQKRVCKSILSGTELLPLGFDSTSILRRTHGTFGVRFLDHCPKQ